MEVGDPRKTAILGVIAVAAIGFLVVRLMPEGRKQAGTSAKEPVPVGSSSSGAGSEAMIVSLIGDPFSHPMLARSITTGPAGPAPTPSPTGTGTPFGSQEGGSAPIQIQTLPTPNPSPGPGTAADPHGVPPSAIPKISLKGILCATESIAYLSLDGGASSGFRVGDTVSPGITLKVITPDTIVLQRGTKTQALKVGQQAEL